MNIKLPGVYRFSFENLVFLGSLSIRVLSCDKSRVEQVPNLLVNLLGRISDPDHTAYRSGNLALDVNERSIGVNFDYLLIHGRGALVTHVT